jgi:hypothetical protein
MKSSLSTSWCIVQELVKKWHIHMCQYNIKASLSWILSQSRVKALLHIIMLRSSRVIGKTIYPKENAQFTFLTAGNTKALWKRGGLMGKVSYSLMVLDWMKASGLIICPRIGYRLQTKRNSHLYKVYYKQFNS